MRNNFSGSFYLPYLAVALSLQST